MMKKLVFGLLVLGLVAGAVTAQYHDSKYLFGGYGTSSTSTITTYAHGPYLCDTAAQTYMRLGPAHAPATSLKWYYGYGMCMDVDNTKVINLQRGSTSSSYNIKSGLFRTDPATQTLTTISADPDVFYSTNGAVHVNQDGDYVFPTYMRVTSPTTTYQYKVMKLASVGGAFTTLFTSQQTGWTGSTTFYHGGARDINNGHYVVQPYNSGAGIRYGILNVSQDGSTFSTWSTGGSYGLYSYYYDGLCQDWDTGNWLSVYSGMLYQLTPGTMNRTTLYNLGYPGGLSLYQAGKFDLRSAPNKRIMIGAYYITTNSQNQIYYAPAVCAIDLKPPYIVTATVCDPKGLTAPHRNYPYCFDFYRGRHVQTIKVGPKKWQLRFSCPNYPLKQYVAAISLSGYKPAIPLPDGRKIYLAADGFTTLSLLGLLNPFFNAGPQRLDANGVASGTLDFSHIPSADIPMWIAMAVIDLKAPSGIAYLPDTYVFRIP